MQARRGYQGLAWVVAGLVASALAAPAGAADFYQGKQLTIVVGFTPGGTYDLGARLYARVLAKHLPGRPTVIVQNMPGAGSLTAAAHLYNIAAKDGTVLGVVGGGVVVEALIGNAQAKYDPRRFAWIGSRTRDNFLCVAFGTSGVRSIADVKSRELIVGSTGPGSRTMTFPRALNELIGTKFKIVSGYPGGNEITMAMEKGEVEGYCGWSLDSISSRAPDWLPTGRVKALAQFTLARTAGLPGVPFAEDLAPNETGRQAIKVLASDSTLAWPFVAPPGLPSERIGELRTAFEAASRDADLLAEARKAKLEIDPVPGSELQDLIDQVGAAPPEVLDLVRKVSAR
jgi:tripartite-type tricarboxylate transporter receptor subunit TctC